MSKPLLFKTQFGINGCNTYVYGIEGKECVIIDLGSNQNDVVERYIEKHHSRCVGVLLTHGHFDHLEGFRELKDIKKYPVFIGADDVRCLFEPEYNVSIGLFDDPFVLPDDIDYRPLRDGEIIEVGELRLKTIATPYHTLGGMCFYDEANKVLFSGDSVFRHGIGRSDLKGAAPRYMAASLKKIAALPKDTVIYCGHGSSASVEFVLRYNSAFSNL